MPLRPATGADRSPPWHITRSSDVFAADSQHNRSQAVSSFRDLGVRNMATYMVVHEVDDVDHWLHSPKRQEIIGSMGVTGQLFTDTAKSNRVGLILEIPDMEAFQQLLESEAGADAMKFDGVRPEARRPDEAAAVLAEARHVFAKLGVTGPSCAHRP